MQKGQCDIKMPGYEQVFYSADRKGYSGTAVFSRIPMKSVRTGIGIDLHDHEGRAITCEFEDFYLVCCYTPNSQNELARLDYRMTWEDDFRAYLKKLEETKPVVLCGDLNVAHKEIDLKNPKTNRKNAGFTDEERGKMTEMLEAGFTDTFRYFYPELEGVYSWWSYRFNARKNNAGWRIDYFLVSESLNDKLVDAKILTDVMGSDHCPVTLEMSF
jgi:exodeoxyribonuclease-3